MNDSRVLATLALTHRCDPAAIPFETTADVHADDRVIGQERASAALALAAAVPHDDCNVFVMGPAGVGKRALVRETLARRAGAAPRPSDWVYVNNFAAPHRPTAIELPPGRGVELRRDMQQLIGDLQRVIPSIFESEEYAQRAEKIQSEFNSRREKAITGVGAEAEAQGLSLVRTPVGYGFLPAKDGKVLDAEAFDALPDEERARYAAAIAALQERLEKVIRDTLRARKESSERLAQLNREMVMLAIEQPVEDLVRRWAQWPKVVEYLHAVQRDALENADSFQRSGEADGDGAEGGDLPLRRYQVNVLVDRSNSPGAAVLFCDHPTYANLVGRAEHVQRFGTLVTDFTRLKAGALHSANGGYLVIDALAILVQPFAWEALKRALRRREIRMEAVSELWGVAATGTLEPEPIPLAVRVVLVGERRLYYLLQAFDAEFAHLFKIVADFDDALDRDVASTAAYARLAAGIAQRDLLLPFDRAAIARLVDEAARRSADARKLSADRGALTRLMREADFAARQAGRARVGAADVDGAIGAHRARSLRLRGLVQESIVRGKVLIDTHGRTEGQVNALALLDLGEVAFAVPSRITATTRVGDGHVIDVQRESHMGGPIHSKGVMILSQFLAARFSANEPHSLAASLAFEQNYGGVEGDSASLAELCALLSSLAGLPARQSLAVTGSVDQRGDVQAVGGVNEKIEGFFETCRLQGLDGTQGVIIPAANADDLMLDAAVVEAASRGLFHVHPVSRVDEALELLTEVPAAAANERAASRLREFARVRMGQERRLHMPSRKRRAREREPR